MAWRIDSVTTSGDIASFTLGYQPGEQYLAVSRVVNEGALAPGEPMDIAVELTNYGSATEGGTATVVPGSFLPSFQVVVPAGVPPLGTVLVEPLGNPIAPDDLGMVGARIATEFQFSGNIWIDTLQVYLPQVSTNLPVSTGPAIGSSQDSLVVMASSPGAVAGIVGHQQRWSRAVIGTVTGIAIHPSASHVFVSTENAGGSLVYLLSAANGATVNAWSYPGAQLAQPGVAVAHGYGTWVINDRLYRYDTAGDPFEEQEFQRETIGLPLAPTWFACGPDSTYCIVGQGFVVILNYWARRIHPAPDLLIPVDDREYFAPSGGDLTNGDDLRSEYVVPFRGTPHGGHLVVSYGYYDDSTGVGEYRYVDGEWGTGRQPVPGAFGWSRHSSANSIEGPVLLYGFADDDSASSCQVVDLDNGGGEGRIRMPGSASWYSASLDLLGLGSNVILSVSRSRGQILIGDRLGWPLVEGGSHSATPDSLGFVGPALIVDGVDDVFQEIWVPATVAPGTWSYRVYRTQGMEKDWYGLHGNGQNTRCHPYLGRRADPRVMLTIQAVGSDTVVLRGVRHRPEDPLLGYRVYSYIQSDSLPSDSVTLDILEPDFTLPVATSRVMEFFTAEAIVPRPHGIGRDGSYFWGGHNR